MVIHYEFSVNPFTVKYFCSNLSHTVEYFLEDIPCLYVYVCMCYVCLCVSVCVYVCVCMCVYAYVCLCNRNRNLRTSKALLKSQAHQGTSLFTSAATNQRGFPKGGQEKLRSEF